ncbi:uncharacterized protein LOC141713589 [Apium graveolens]|uniref:uncharacterized protein LOC141713589 n=1 Tax=Apium graveolens TaxID=4045 RepID=UPI003D7AE363
MSELSTTKSWQDELASLVEDTGIRYSGDGSSISTPSFKTEADQVEQESFVDQVKGFGKAWGEIIIEFGKGCKDVAAQQNIVTGDCYVVKKIRGHYVEVSGRLSFLNEFLPEDRHPAHVWPILFFVFILSLAALGVNTKDVNSVTLVKKVYIHPPSATRIVLPDGRHLAYHEQGLTADRARYSLIAPHSFLSSRLAGIPGVKLALLEEFGVRLITYDLPGFGESDPHPSRSLNSSALDILYLANSVAISDKFWVLGYSDGAMHAWAALKYIPNKIAGAAMIGPMVNPYQSGMTKEEISGTWEKWMRRRKLMYYLARRFPDSLGYFYRRTFLSGKHGHIEKWLSLSLGNRDKALTEGPLFEAFWHRDVEESVRQGSTTPFIEEASLLVSDWGFSLSDLQVQQKCPKKGLFSWLKFMYTQEECQLTGYLGPIHIWQGMDDKVVPPSMADYVSRVLPNAKVHKLPEDGHFSYFFYCDECHRNIFATLFGTAQGPLNNAAQIEQEKPE